MRHCHPDGSTSDADTVARAHPTSEALTGFSPVVRTTVGRVGHHGQMAAAGRGALPHSTPEPVSRVTSALRREGIIDSERRRTSTLDREALDEWAVEV